MQIKKYLLVTDHLHKNLGNPNSNGGSFPTTSVSLAFII